MSSSTVPIAMSSNRQFQPVNKREVLEHMKIEQKREIVQVKAEGPPETKLVDHPEAKVCTDSDTQSDEG